MRIECLDAAAKASVAGEGLTIHRDSFLFPAVHFTDCPGELLSNESFVDTFSRLNNAGIAFGEDYKQGWAPADIMRELQSRGRITAPFTTIAWRGPDDWFTTVDFRSDAFLRSVGYEPVCIREGAICVNAVSPMHGLEELEFILQRPVRIAEQ